MIRDWKRNALPWIFFVGSAPALAASAGQFVPEEVPPSPLQSVRVLPPQGGGVVHGPGTPAEGLKGTGPARADQQISQDQVKHRSDAKDGHLAKGAGTNPQATAGGNVQPGGRFEAGPPVVPKPAARPRTPEKK